MKHAIHTRDASSSSSHALVKMHSFFEWLSHSGAKIGKAARANQKLNSFSPVQAIKSNDRIVPRLCWQVLMRNLAAVDRPQLHAVR